MNSIFRFLNIGRRPFRRLLTPAVLFILTGAATAGAVQSGQSPVSARGAAFVYTFTNNTFIDIPEVGVAAPYPSGISVSDVVGAVTKATITLTGITQAIPDDLDLLLVSPTGQTLLLMSDCGGNGALDFLTLTFDDDAAALPNGASPVIATGSYKPTNYEAGDVFPSPAPAAPYGSTLSVFNAQNPNGVWQLYVLDDRSPDPQPLFGFINQWSLTLTTTASGDAGVVSLTSPVFPVAAGTSTVAVSIKNYDGGAALSSAAVNWSVNGVLQTPASLSAPVSSGATAVLTLGTLDIASGAIYRLKVWTSAPNGGADARPQNDTLQLAIGAPLSSGAYSIGAAAPVFKTIAEAAGVLSSGGITGAGGVTFTVEPGVYTDSVRFGHITGASSSNRIVFQAAGEVTIANDAPAPSGATLVVFDTTDFVTFDGIHLRMGGTALSQSVYIGYDVRGSATNGCSNLIIRNGAIRMNAGGVVQPNSYGIRQRSKPTLSTGASSHTDNLYETLTVKGAAVGIEMATDKGAATTSLFADRRNRIFNCVFDSLGASVSGVPTKTRGIVISGGSDVRIEQNTLTALVASDVIGIEVAATGSASFSGFAGTVSGNKVSGVLGKTGGAPRVIGIAVDVPGAGFGELSVYNNFVSDVSTAFASSLPYTFGMQIGSVGSEGASASARPVQARHNTVWLSAPAPVGFASSACSVTNGAVATLRGNLFINTLAGSTPAVQGYAIYSASDDGSSGTLTANFNNFYSSGSALGQYKDSAAATLADWQRLTAQDTLSVSRPVNFISATDLHLTGASLGDRELGLPRQSTVPTDIDGEARRDTTYMGADEGSIQVPVELTAFTGAFVNGAVRLDWTTASERNNSGFEIERSTAGAPVWQPVGFVKGNGTTTESRAYTFVDAAPPAGAARYRLKQMDFDGALAYSATVEVSSVAPRRFALGQNYPNPFNPETVIEYDLPAAADIRLTVFDVVGRQIRTLVSERQLAGSYRVRFNAAGLASGVYFYRLEARSSGSQASDVAQTRKLLLLK